MLTSWSTTKHTGQKAELRPTVSSEEQHNWQERRNARGSRSYPLDRSEPRGSTLRSLVGTKLPGTVSRRLSEDSSSERSTGRTGSQRSGSDQQGSRPVPPVRATHRPSSRPRTPSGRPWGPVYWHSLLATFREQRARREALQGNEGGVSRVILTSPLSPPDGRDSAPGTSSGSLPPAAETRFRQGFGGGFTGTRLSSQYSPSPSASAGAPGTGQGAQSSSFAPWAHDPPSSGPVRGRSAALMRQRFEVPGLRLPSAVRLPGPLWTLQDFRPPGG
ncbi:hypothetical protein CSUI_010268, partial [Cystoisospora suis]